MVEAGKQALDKYGAGLSSVRFICGTQDIHINLEKKISQFHGREDTILYPSCLDANAGLFEALLNEEDCVISDELNHASIIDGIRLCKAKRYRYKHRDMKDLEKILASCGQSRFKLIATDGVFSMDGNVAPLDKICDLADKYQALVFLDECHATGFFGKTGRGTEEIFNLPGRVDIINSTLGKALGGAAGGYTTASKSLTTLLRQRSRPYLFSNSIPPSVVACASQVFDLLLESPKYPEKVARLTLRFRSKMIQANFKVLGDDHPICPIFLGDSKLATLFADKMLGKYLFFAGQSVEVLTNLILFLEKGIYVIGFSYPVVPKNKARIRVQISASHTEDDIDQAVEAFIEVGKSLNVI